MCTNCGYRGTGPQEVTWSPDGRMLYVALIGGSAVLAIPVPPGEPLPPLPPNGLTSIEDAGALPGAKPMPVPGAIAGASPSVYVYAKVSAQRYIFQVRTRWKSYSMNTTATRTAFVAARDFILKHRTDYETAVRDFEWPVHDRFN